MAGLVKQRCRPPHHVQVVKKDQVQFAAVVRERSPPGIGTVGILAAASSDVVVRVPRETAAPVENRARPVLVARIGSGVIQQPNGVESPSQRLVGIAAIVVAPAVLPVVVVESPCRPGIVHERLPADARAIEIVAARILVGYRVGAGRHYFFSFRGLGGRFTRPLRDFAASGLGLAFRSRASARSGRCFLGSLTCGTSRTSTCLRSRTKRSSAGNSSLIFRRNASSSISSR